MCQHAEYLLLNEADYFSDSLWDLNSAQICRCLDDVTLPEPACPVSLIGETEWGLLASVALNRNNFPRNTVLCNKSRYVQCLDCPGTSSYKCQHCRFFSNWLAKDCNDTYLKQRLGEWTLREESQLQHKLHNPAQSAWRNTVGTAQVGQDPVDPQTMPLVEMMTKGMPYPFTNAKSGMPEPGDKKGLRAVEKDSLALNDVEARMGRESTSSAEDVSSFQVINLGNTSQKEGELCTKEIRNGVESDPGSSSHLPAGIEPRQTPTVTKSTLNETTTSPPMCKKKKSQDSRKILPNVLEKRCNKCGAVKRASAYYRDGKDETGLQSWCRACCLRHGPRAHERLVQRTQKKLRQPPRTMTGGVVSQSLPKCTYGALGNHRAFEISSDNRGRESIRMPNPTLDPGMAPYMPSLSPCNTMCQLDLQAMNLQASSMQPMQPMQIINPNSFPQVCATSSRNRGLETSPLHLYGFQPDDVRLLENKGAPLVPYVMDIKQSMLQGQDPTFHPDSMASKDVYQPGDFMNIDTRRGLHPTRSDMSGLQMPTQGQWGPMGTMGSTPYIGGSDLTAGSACPQHLLPWPEYPVNLSSLGISSQGGAGVPRECAKGLQIQATGLDAVRLQQDYSMEKQGQLSESQLSSARVDGLNYMPSGGLLSVSPALQQLNNSMLPIQMNFIPEQMGNVPYISLKADEDQPDYCSSWIGTPDSDSMGTQGSGSREWSAPGGSHTAANSHGSETNLREVGMKTGETPDELIPIVADTINTQGMHHIQKNPLQELQGGHSQCHNTGVSPQQYNRGQKRKPLAPRRVAPSLLVPVSSDANTCDLMHGSSIQASYRTTKRQRQVESYARDALDTGSAISPYPHHTEGGHPSRCNYCGAQQSSSSILRNGLCSLCSMIQPIMKTSDACCLDKSQQKFISMRDSCPEHGPESFLPVPSRELSPSEFLSDNIVADEDRLPDPAGDAAHDDGHFATLAFLRHDSDHSFAGPGVIGANYNTQSPLGI